MPSSSTTNKKKVLVVGATGRTGKHVVQMLLNQGHSVVAVARSEEKMMSLLVQKEYGSNLIIKELSLPDLTSQDCQELTQDCDAVVRYGVVVTATDWQCLLQLCRIEWNKRFFFVRMIYRYCYTLCSFSHLPIVHCIFNCFMSLQLSAALVTMGLHSRACTGTDTLSVRRPNRCANLCLVNVVDSS